MNVLSLFDGIACGLVALKRLNIKVTNYFASEIDKYAIQIAMKNHPEIVQLGDIKNWKEWNLPKIDLLIGGSPCQGFSFSGKQLNFEDERSKLFFEYVDILNELNPEYFLLENVVMKKKFRDVITGYLRVTPIMIDSALVSAQSRKRLYWTNIDVNGMPVDKKMYLKDIIEDNVDESYFIDNVNFDFPHVVGKLSEYQNDKIVSIFGKSKTITAMGGNRDGNGGALYSFKNLAQEKAFNNLRTVGEKSKTLTATGQNVSNSSATNLICGTRTIEIGKVNVEGYEMTNRIYSIDGKSPTLITGDKKISTDNLTCRKLTPLECERLQTLPDNYTVGVSNHQRYKMLGNGWTVDVIVHIFSFLSYSPKQRNIIMPQKMSLF